MGRSITRVIDVSYESTVLLSLWVLSFTSVLLIGGNICSFYWRISCVFDILNKWFTFLPKRENYILYWLYLFVRILSYNNNIWYLITVMYNKTWYYHRFLFSTYCCFHWKMLFLMSWVNLIIFESRIKMKCRLVKYLYSETQSFVYTTSLR